MRSPPEAPVKAVIVHDDRTKRNVNVDLGDRNRQREAKPYKLGLELIWIEDFKQQRKRSNISDWVRDIRTSPNIVTLGGKDATELR